MTWHLRTIVAFAIVSMTSLLPYNLFMNAHEYFYYKLRNVTDIGAIDDDEDLFTALYRSRNVTHKDGDHSTELQRNYEGWFTVMSGLACILGALLNTLATNKLSNGFRVTTGHAIVILSLLPTLLFTFIDTDDGQVHFFWLSMLFSSVASFGSMGLIGSGITGLAATFPQSYMQIVMVGQAVAGISTSLLSIVCQAATANALLNGRIYFGLAILWTLISVLSYFCLVRSEYAKEIIDRYEDGHERLLEESDEMEVDGVEREEGGENEEGVVTSLRPIDEPTVWTTYRVIFEKARGDILIAGFILLVTLSAFPAVASLVQTRTLNETWRAYFSSICCFLLFNCCDLMGRVFASRVDISRDLLQKLSAARLLLVPLIISCNIQPRYHTPSLLRNDAFFILLNMALGLSHGFLITHASIKAVKSVDGSLRETAGSVLALVCVAASLLGSMIGVGIVTLI